ncbi:hypothetical protein PG996_002952 [Apiospora saccharicola]|uniref:Heterokaryon incompatibility domain-containing protein n=1 Tax=Apiospora saccharicola TaxID=335842 RepID=A0ABR1WNX6_9PEZI
MVSQDGIPIPEPDLCGPIRLLLLQPGLPSDPLVLKIVHSQLIPDLFSADRPYEAISYRWGGPEEHIQCLPEGTLSIHGNIGKALRRFRRPQEERALWTDEICINQIDEDEKSTRFQQMGTVYACASQVLIYLGDGVSKIGDMDDMSAMGAFEGLYSNSRGSKIMEGVLFCSGSNGFTESGWSRRLLVRSLQWLSVVRKRSPGNDFISGLHESRHLSSTRNGQGSCHTARISLVAMGNYWTIYLYTQVAKGILEETKSLGILSAAAGRPSTQCPSIQLPSWVPDWSYPEAFSRPPESLVMHQTANERPFSAGGSCGEIDIDLAQRMLTVRGFRVSIVHRLCEQLRIYRGDGCGNPDWRSMDILLRHFRRHYNYSPELPTYSSSLLEQVKDLSEYVDIISVASEETNVSILIKVISGESEGTADSVARSPSYVQLAKTRLAQMLLNPESNELSVEAWLGPFTKRSFWATGYRGLWETENGHRGLFPTTMLEGDVIVILEGGPVP